MTSSRDTKGDIALLVGDPTAVEITMTKEKQAQLGPYTKPKDSSEPEDQYTEIVTFRVDGALKRLGEETAALLHPWYRTHSDLARDAYYKWLKFLQEEFLAPGSAVEPLALKLDLLSRHAYETETRRKFLDLMTMVDRNLGDLLNDGATEKMAEETATYCDNISSISDTYWRNRSIREFVEIPSFNRVLNALRNNPVYKDSPLVRLMTTWKNQRFVQQRED